MSRAEDKVDRLENVMQRLQMFHRLSRKATDEIGWISLAYSCSRARAGKMIEEARIMFSKEFEEMDQS